MSHIVTIETQVRDPVAVAAACRRLGLSEPTHSTATLFTDEATGRIVQLPGWQYPLVCQTETGRLLFDNFGGQWGGEPGPRLCRRAERRGAFLALGRRGLGRSRGRGRARPGVPRTLSA